MKCMVRNLAPAFVLVLLVLFPIPKARAGFFIGISGANFAFSFNSGLNVYQSPVYPGYLYCTNVYCYRWVGYGWYYAPWGGGPWVLAPAGFLLPPPLIYGPPPPLVVVYRPYFVWWRGYVGPWYAIHHPVWWSANRVYIAHYNVWRVHVIRTYGPRVSAAVWTQPRALGMRPRFLPPGHQNIRWAQRQWARTRPDLYGRQAVRSFYRAHPMLLRQMRARQAYRRQIRPYAPGGRGRIHPMPGRGYSRGRGYQPYRYGRRIPPYKPFVGPKGHPGHPSARYRYHRQVVPKCRNPKRCF